ncbi:dioxygenase family protein [Methylobrevis albus]|uniref:Intradiol ring-cleavage dioxygenase n=1 Tax=Methylobrevis albus TaxID=2793297 RepID=A0A931MXC3_9HYPH|nr:intradiol ring-cleavage dioxygenase [Methylobrevis albus]MBH0236635.1 intradiol ring-cleavage dioxygenase [Methylobrevis albus]
MTPSRRRVLAAFLAAPGLPFAGRALAAPPPLLAATPACADDDDPTPAQTEGPYFTPDSPPKRDFAADAPGGERMTIAGFVLDRDCRPVAEALIELWHADPAGEYDNTGYRLRGHQFSDAEGRWWFDTVVPGLYPGRTRHFHVKVQRRGGRVLTTQLYFPGEPDNAADGIYDAALLMQVDSSPDGRFGRYDFVLG